eukprot:g503.t1
MRVFVNDATGYVGQEVLQALCSQKYEVVGTVATESDVAEASKNGAQNAFVPAADRAAAADLILSADVTVLSTEAGLDEVQDALGVLEDSAADGTLRRVVLISSVLTWARTAAAARRPEPADVVDEDDAADEAEELALAGTSEAQDSNDEPECFLFESDHNLRAPASRFASLKALEDQALALGRAGGAMQSCVVAAGLTYGGLGGDFSVLLRDAWMVNNSTGADGARGLAITSIGDASGSRQLPTIHVADLANFVARLVSNEDGFPSAYAVAVDGASGADASLASITAAAASALGDGKTVQLSDADARAALMDEPALSRLQIDMSFSTKGGTLSILAEAAAAKEHRRHKSNSGVAGCELLGFRCPNGIARHMQEIASEFVQTRQLTPLRIVVMGPPGAGVEDHAQHLSCRYHLPLLSVEACAAEAVAAVETSDGAAEEAENVAEPSVGAKIRAAHEAAGEASVTAYDPALTGQLLREAMAAPAARNKGWVLQGAPTTLEEAKYIFSEREVTDDGKLVAPGTGPDGLKLANAVRPTQVLLLACDDDAYLTQSAMNAVYSAGGGAEEKVAAGDTDEDKEVSAAREAARKQLQADISKQLELARQNHGHKDDTQRPIFLFEKEYELETLELAVGPDAPAAVSGTRATEAVESYVARTSGGAAPFNFHPTRKELAQQRREGQQLARAKTAEQKAAQAQAKAAQEEAQRFEVQNAAARQRAIQAHEQELLEARSLPLRNFLMSSVMPSLTEGLLDVVQQQPDDPIDHLAEFLFRKNLETEEQKENSDFKSEFVVSAREAKE